MIYVNLNANTAVGPLGCVKLTPLQAEMLFVLADSHPRSVATEEMARRMYGRGREPIEIGKKLNALARSLRAILAEAGVEIAGTSLKGFSLKYSSTAGGENEKAHSTESEVEARVCEHAAREAEGDSGARWKGGRSEESQLLSGS